MRNKIVLMLLVALLIVSVSSSFKTTPTADALIASSITITGGVDNAGDCGIVDNSFRVNVDAVGLFGEDADNAGGDEWIIAVFDADGHHITNWIGTTPVSTSQTLNISTGNWGNVASHVNPTARPFQARLIDTPDVAGDVDVHNHINLPPLLTSGMVDPSIFTSACAGLPDRSKPPVLSLPVHKAHTTDTTPTFTWSAVAGATTYRIIIQNEAGTFEYKKVVTGTTHTPTTPLPAGDKYLWRVRTKVDAFGIFGRWSSRNTLFVD